MNEKEAAVVAEPQRHHLAARMGRWSAHHRKIAIFGWLGFCFVAFALGSVIGTSALEPADAGVRESGRMDRLLDKDFKTPAGERVIIQSSSLTARDAEFQAVVTDVVNRMKARPEVTNLRSPLVDTSLISPDQHSALVDFELTGDPD